MKSMLQFVAVMDKLIQMIAMLKMQVSQNGLKASVNKKPELHQAPHSRGFLFIAPPHCRVIFCRFKLSMKKYLYIVLLDD